MDFFSLPQEQGNFSQTEFRSTLERGFHRTRAEAMPDNSLRAPARWTPPAPTAPAAPPQPSALAAPAPAASQTALDEQVAEHIRAKAFAEGLAQGRREGAAETEARLQAQIEGARSHGLQAIHNLLIQLGEAVHGLQQQPETLHEPLKRLALHLAEELVLGELGLDASAIDRLVQRCVDAVDGQGASQLVVELHPADLSLLQQHPDAEADRPQGWVWQANEQLLPGSVRVRLNEALVSDFIEHRLHSLAKQLLAQPQRWAAQSAFVPEKLAERRRQDAPVEDALPRMGAAQEPATGERPPAWAQASGLSAHETMSPELPARDLLDLEPAADPAAPQPDADHA